MENKFLHVIQQQQSMYRMNAFATGNGLRQPYNATVLERTLHSAMIDREFYYELFLFWENLSISIIYMKNVPILAELSDFRLRAGEGPERVIHLTHKFERMWKFWKILKNELV